MRRAVSRTARQYTIHTVIRLALTAITAAVLSCAETGQEQVTIPLYVAGTDLSQTTLAAGDVPVSVTRADLAFGPLYLCAGTTAGDLCDAARLEWLGTAVVDLTSETPRRVGDLEGSTGVVRSWMFDLGISSQLTSVEPVVLDAAAELGAVSLVVEGSALVDDASIPFRVAIPIMQTDDTELGVPILRKSTSDAFERNVDARDAGLIVRFDAGEWLANVDFRPYVEDAACAVGGAPIVCAGTIEQTCDDEGTAVSIRDCGTLEQACLPGTGCQSHLQLQADSEPYRALRNAVTSGSRPTFEWASRSNASRNGKQEQ